MILMRSFWTKYHIRCVPRPYSRYLDMFTGLFCPFINFYGPKCPKISQSWSWLTKPEYHVYDWNVILMRSCWTKYRIRGVSRPYSRYLDMFTGLFCPFINFYGPKCPKISQSWSWLTKPEYHVYDWNVILNAIILD